MFDRRLLTNFDWIFFLLVMAICLMGVVAIYSASLGYTDNTEYWLRQLFWIGIALGIGLVVLLIDFRAIGSLSYFIHGGVLLILLVLMLFDVGAGRGGVNRWFMVGSVAVQPSEFVKLSLVMAVAHYFRDNSRVGNLGLKGLFWPAAMMLTPFFLIVNQPDLGTAMMLALVFIPVIVLAGVKPRLLGAAAVIGVIAIVALVAAFNFGYFQIDSKVIAQLKKDGAHPQLLTDLKLLGDEKFYRKNQLWERIPTDGEGRPTIRLAHLIEEHSFRPFISSLLRPYQQRRLITFINPDYDPLGAGYHVIQSKVAIGSGKFWGKGYMQSTQGALNFLPARHTDFLFSIFAEEWGFVGGGVLISLYVALILRGLSIMLQTHDHFSAFLILGILSIITFQVLINLGMVVGMLPVVGVPLPFFSYGGSSLITLMIGVGLILNIRMRRFLWS